MTALATASADLHSPARVAGEMDVAGDSSRSFWWRRWIEQSRSPRWTTDPVPVAQHLDLDVARFLDELLEIEIEEPKAACASD